MLASTPRAGALGDFMQSVGRQYVKAFNHRHGRSGALWEGRYRSTVVEASTYLLDCMRLIEQAPLREQLVPRLADWPWSSAAHHLGQKVDGIVTEHPRYWQLGNTPFEREARYAQAIASPMGSDVVSALSRAAWHGWPLGTPEFVSAVAEATGREVRPRPRGRPRTKELSVPIK